METPWLDRQEEPLDDIDPAMPNRNPKRPVSSSNKKPLSSSTTNRTPRRPIKPRPTVASSQRPYSRPGYHWEGSRHHGKWVKNSPKKPTKTPRITSQFQKVK